jgi:hypothetical protein
MWKDHTIPAMTDTCFNACNTIMVENVVAEPASIARFIAGQRVMLKPGVHFMAGSDVNVFISTNGIFCEDIPLVAVQEESKLAESTDSKGMLGLLQRELTIRSGFILILQRGFLLWSLTTCLMERIAFRYLALWEIRS